MNAKICFWANVYTGVSGSLTPIGLLEKTTTWELSGIIHIGKTVFVAYLGLKSPQLRYILQLT